MTIEKDNVFRIYLSHQIRGPNGIKATQEEINRNITKHIAIGNEIKAYLLDWEKMDSFVKCSLYVPAEHDEFVQLAYNKKYLDETEILSIDCNIIDRCNLLIAFGDYSLSRGMQVEIEFAIQNKTPVFYMSELNRNIIESLKFAIQIVLKEI